MGAKGIRLWIKLNQVIKPDLAIAFCSELGLPRLRIAVLGRADAGSE